MTDFYYTEYLKLYCERNRQYPRGINRINNYSENDKITIEKLSQKIYEAIWFVTMQIINIKSKSGESNPNTSSNTTSPSKQQNRKQGIIQFLNQRVSLNINKLSLFKPQKRNILKDLTEKGTIWHFILRSRIAIDFYNYFNGNDEFLSDEFTSFINHLYHLYQVRSLQGIIALQETWQDIDIVIALFLYKCRTGQKVLDKDIVQKKAEQLILANRDLAPYLYPKKASLRPLK
jgi:hypothetical protein